MTLPTSTSPSPFNPSKSNPTLSDLLSLLKKDIFLNLNCHHVGTIQTFNSVNQTATATINYQRTFEQPDASTGTYGARLVPYPIAVGCPVVCLGGGSAALTFPIQAGDECLILFNDRDLDNWFQGAGGAGVATSRLHSFADGIILVGLRSLQNSLSNYDATHAVLRNGAAQVGVSSSQVKLANVVNGTLGVSMTILLAALQTFLAATAAATTASQIATAAGVFEAAIVTAVINIEGILE